MTAKIQEDLWYRNSEIVINNNHLKRTAKIQEDLWYRNSEIVINNNHLKRTAKIQEERMSTLPSLEVRVGLY